MADNILASAAVGVGATFATKDIGGVAYPRSILVTPAGVDVSPLTDTQLRATAIPISGTVTVNTISGFSTEATLAALSAKWVAADSTTAANEATADRLKVNAALRILDTAQAVGSQLVAAKGDQTSGLWVNVKNASLAVTGTFWQATQPVSGTFWQATQPVSGTFFQATQPISAVSLPLPAGASTAAKQPALGTAGVAATDVITVQGIASGVAQPISAASLPLPTGAATETTLAALNTKVTAVNTGAVVLAAGTALAGKFGIDQTTPGTTNAVTDTKLPTAAASADGLANPTITQIGTEAMLFNGTTWDRQRNNVNTTTGDTGTKTVSFAGATQTNYNARGAIVTIICGTVSGTTPTLTAQLQFSPDAGTTWLAFSAISTAVTATGNTVMLVAYPTAAALTSGATAAIQTNGPLPRTWRVNYVIGGTTPSFAITSVQVNYIV